MLGWWRLLLLYGIAINLAIDEAISTASNVNGSTALDVNGSTAPELNSSTAPELNSSTAPELNSSTAPELNSSTAPELNSSTAPELNSSTVEDENVVARRVRQKRLSHSTAVPVLFASALVKAVAIRSGKRVVNTSIDRFLGGELGDFKFFSGDYACSAKCDGGWGNCVPSYEATPGDSCCVTNYTLKCCDPPEFSDGNSTKLEAVGQKLYLKTPISCRIDSTELCDFEQQAHILVKQPTNISLETGRDLLQKCDHFRMAFYGKRNYYDDDTLIVQPSFFVENRERCPMCGWELCIIMTQRLSCSCCAYDNLADCRWGSRRLELNGSNTKAEISKAFLMLLVMRLAVRRILAEMATN